MTTPELLSYIKAEIAKGKTREEIRKILMSEGEWTEDDLSEAFRMIIPMGSVIVPASPPPISTPTLNQAPIATPNFQPKEIKPTAPSPSFVPLPPPHFSPSVAPVPPSPATLKPIMIRPREFFNQKPFSSSHFLSSFLKFIVILIIIGGLGFGFWRYHLQVAEKVMNLWNSLIDYTSNLFIRYMPNKN